MFWAMVTYTAISLSVEALCTTRGKLLLPASDAPLAHHGNTGQRIFLEQAGQVIRSEQSDEEGDAEGQPVRH